MTVFRTRALLVLVVLIAIGSSEPILAVEVSRHADGCRVLASTRKSEAGRDPESRTTCARVDNRPSPHFLRPPQEEARASYRPAPLPRRGEAQGQRRQRGQARDQQEFALEASAVALVILFGRAIALRFV